MNYDCTVRPPHPSHMLDHLRPAAHDVRNVPRSLDAIKNRAEGNWFRFVTLDEYLPIFEAELVLDVAARMVDEHHRVSPGTQQKIHALHVTL